jgi:peptide/nickel transport system ATP-binding protein
VTDALLTVEDLRTHFPVGRGWGGPRAVVKAVDGVSFTVPRRRIVGLVGESGSGKTTVGRSILRLVEPTGGRVVFDGTDVTALAPGPLRALRRRRHEFSGGQRQRIGIARALAVGPEFIVADEAVSALDVSVQAQVLNLLQDLQEDLGLTLLFIAHDLAVVDHLCDEVVVMYLGRVMEAGPVDAVIGSPAHPYTRALLSAAPVPDPTAPRGRTVLAGDIPSPIDAPSGCVFRTRCPHALPACADGVPSPRPVGPGHVAACIREDLS